MQGVSECICWRCDPPMGRRVPCTAEPAPTEPMRLNVSEAHTAIHYDKCLHLPNAGLPCPLFAILEAVRRGAQTEYKEALIWCGGSADFAHGGRARKGWVKIVLPLLGKPWLT